jgi:hypothetical protein
MPLDTRRTIRFSLLGWLLLTALLPTVASAHVGAPYPVLLEEPIGPYTLSALADPDVGGGTFYVLVEHQGASTPAGTTVTLWAEPADGHLDAAAYAAAREETRYGERFVAEVPFDAEGAWQMRLVVDGPAGTGEAAFPVEVTPPGTGWIATVACLLPFALLAALWLRGIMRRRSAAAARGRDR